MNGEAEVQALKAKVKELETLLSGAEARINRVKQRYAELEVEVKKERKKISDPQLVKVRLDNISRDIASLDKHSKHFRWDEDVYPMVLEQVEGLITQLKAIPKNIKERTIKATDVETLDQEAAPEPRPRVERVERPQGQARPQQQYQQVGLFQ